MLLEPVCITECQNRSRGDSSNALVMIFIGIFDMCFNAFLSFFIKSYKTNKVILSEKNVERKKELVTNTDLLIEKEIIGIIKKYYPESKWKINNKIKNFSKTNYGLQKGSKLTKNFSKSKNVVNLDIDFSVSRKGYYRSVHRDRETRVISFLIYLNSLSSKDGGAFEVYKSKKEYKNANQYPRFPSYKDVQLEKKF